MEDIVIDVEVPRRRPVPHEDFRRVNVGMRICIIIEAACSYARPTLLHLANVHASSCKT